MPFLPPNQQCQSTEGIMMTNALLNIKYLKIRKLSEKKLSASELASYYAGAVFCQSITSTHLRHQQQGLLQCHRRQWRQLQCCQHAHCPCTGSVVISTDIHTLGCYTHHISHRHWGRCCSVQDLSFTHYTISAASVKQISLASHELA